MKPRNNENKNEMKQLKATIKQQQQQIKTYSKHIVKFEKLKNKN